MRRITTKIILLAGLVFFHFAVNAEVPIHNLEVNNQKSEVSNLDVVPTQVTAVSIQDETNVDSSNSIPVIQTPAPTVLSIPSVPVNENEVKAGLLYDVVAQKIIWEKGLNNSFPIASLTKMMVALLAVEDVRAGKFNWDDKVCWTRETIVGRKKNLKHIYTNASYTLRDVFKAAMIASNNECAEQLARYIGLGDRQATILRMNTRAQELKMFGTFFNNPTGLPESRSVYDNRSTPSDLLNLSLEMLKYKEVIDIASMGYASIENGSTSNVISNHNRLTIDYSGEVDGLKTGYTRRAGFCLVATAAKCDHRLISIVLGCRGPQIRNEVVRDMFNDYYTSINLDKLGVCPNEANTEEVIVQNGVKGRYVTITERLKKVHVVKRGENIATVARRYNCTTTQLRAWNKRSMRKNYVYAGQHLMVYINQPHNIFVREAIDETDEDKQLLSDAEVNKIEDAKKESSSTLQNNSIKTPVKYLYHVVSPGDTLFKISQKYSGISVDDLKVLNNLSDNGSLKPGTKIKIRVQS